MTQREARRPPHPTHNERQVIMTNDQPTPAETTDGAFAAALFGDHKQPATSEQTTNGQTEPTPTEDLGAFARALFSPNTDN